MISLASLLVLVLFVFVVFAGNKIINSMLTGGVGTLDDYLEEHPESVKNGRIHCNHCGGGQIYLYRWTTGPGWITNLHMCRQCGARLYRSTTSSWRS